MPLRKIAGGRSAVSALLFYDTETTGLPDWGKPSEDPCQPRITQIAAELCDEDTGNVHASLNLLIKPDGWEIPPELEKLTGITTVRCHQFGVWSDGAIDSFMQLWSAASVRIGHNESFDMRMVRIELMRAHDWNHMGDAWKAGKSFCTLTNSTQLIKLPPSAKMSASGRNGFKPPNLGEAYKFFTGYELVGAHNAMVDVQACKAVYYGIKNYGKK